jgi:hypothetical protein
MQDPNRAIESRRNVVGQRVTSPALSWSACSLTYITEQDIAGRGVIWHDGKVACVLCYKFTTPKGSRDLLIHLTLEGLFTDMDIVGDPIPGP